MAPTGPTVGAETPMLDLLVSSASFLRNANFASSSRITLEYSSRLKSSSLNTASTLSFSKRSVRCFKDTGSLLYTNFTLRAVFVSRKGFTICKPTSLHFINKDCWASAHLINKLFFNRNHTQTRVYNPSKAACCYIQKDSWQASNTTKPYRQREERIRINIHGPYDTYIPYMSNWGYKHHWHSLVKGIQRDSKRKGCNLLLLTCQKVSNMRGGLYKIAIPRRSG